MPLLSVAMDVLPVLHHWGGDKTDRYSTEEINTPTNINHNVALAIAGKLPHTSCDTFQQVKSPMKFISKRNPNVYFCLAS